MFHRDCQTTYWKDARLQIPKEISTQMVNPFKQKSITIKQVPFIYMSSENDRILYSKPYKSADSEESDYIQKVIICQSIFRRYIASRAVDRIRSANKSRTLKIHNVIKLLKTFFNDLEYQKNRISRRKKTEKGN